MSGNTGTSPLMRLPQELRLMILKYILPTDTDGPSTISLWPFEKEWRKETYVLDSSDMYPSRFALRRFVKGITMVNRQLYYEAMAVLYAQSFVIRISENTFRPSGADFHCILRTAIEGVNWQWRDLLPGLNLSRVRELKIEIVPSDYPGVWENAYSCLINLCRMIERSTASQGLRKLAIEITETKMSAANYSPVPMWDWDPEEMTYHDIIFTLDAIGRCLRNVKDCEIRVPNWASNDQRLMNVMEETKDAVCTGGRKCHRQSEVAENNRIEAGGPHKANLEQDGADETGMEGNKETSEEPVAKDEDLWAKSEQEQWDDFYALPRT